MDLRHLRNFVTIVDSGSLSKAAAIVYVAQPALSQQLAALEGELGTQLLLRSRNGVVPTEAGKVLYRHARTMLRHIEQIREEVALRGAAEIGPVTVGLSKTIISVLGVPLFERVRARHPGIRLHLLESMSGYIGELLGLGRLDLAIQFTTAETQGIKVQPLLVEDLYVIGSAGCGNAEGEIPLAELAGVPMVLPLNAPSIRMLVERGFAQSGLDLNLVAEIDSVGTQVEIARSGSACTVLPLSSLVPRRAFEEVPARRLCTPHMRRSVGLAWSTILPRTPAAEAVRRIITELAVELVHSGAWPGAELAISAEH